MDYDCTIILLNCILSTTGMHICCYAETEWDLFFKIELEIYCNVTNYDNFAKRKQGARILIFLCKIHKYTYIYIYNIIYIIFT